MRFFNKKAILYESIDTLPINNWIKIHEKGDLNLLVKKEGVVNSMALSRKWTDLKDEFIDVFGVNDDYKDYLLRHMEIEVLKIEMAVTDDRSIINFISIREFQLKQLIEGQEKSNHRKGMVYVRKFMNGGLNETTTVREYYDIIEVMKQQNQKDGTGE